ncbi:cytochrome P450 [Cyathus striatus]|nr:cytochrome P450 [Cyathus striatus]
MLGSLLEDRTCMLTDATWSLYVAGAIAIFLSWLYLNSEGRKLRHIPTVGYSSPILSFITAFKFLLYAEDVVNEGVDRFNGGPFKIPMLDRWMVVFHGEKYTNEFKKAPDDALSIHMAISETIQVPYTVGSEVVTNPYHLPLIRVQLTKNLDNIFPELLEEVIDSLNDLLPPTQEWKAFQPMNTFVDVVCRITNRTFVGLPLSRNANFLQICKLYTLDVFKDSVIMNMVPSFIRPLSYFVLKNSYRQILMCMKHLEPVISDYEKMNTTGGEMPNNMLAWLLEAAKDEERSPLRLTKRILLANFTAIHTTTHTFVQALYNLVSNPAYIPELREEIEDVVECNGWSRAALESMNKLDSFIKETQRLAPLGSVSTPDTVIRKWFVIRICCGIGQSSRMAIKDYTCNGGTVIPKGTIVALAIDPTHRNGDKYSNPEKFEGFRFVNKGSNSNKVSSMVTLSDDYLAFGIGKHGCPGRFFAANEIKLLLAHVLVTYDFKLAGSRRPKTTTFGSSRIPDMKMDVLFRKRRM